MGDEENPLGGLAVEGGKESLAEAGGQNNQSGAIPLGTRGREGVQCFLLDGVRLGGVFWRFFGHA